MHQASSIRTVPLGSHTSRTGWPTWTFALANGLRIEHTVLVEHGTGTLVLSWRLLDGPRDLDLSPRESQLRRDGQPETAPGAVEAAASGAVLRIRPFLSGRDYHALHHRNDAFNFAPQISGTRVVYSPYAGIPSIAIESTGVYVHRPDWYLNFSYRQEEERGLDSVEDLASPGEWRFTIAPGEPATMILSAVTAGLTGDAAMAEVGGAVAHGGAADVQQGTTQCRGNQSSVTAVDIQRKAEAITLAEQRRRAAFEGPFRLSADTYVVARGRGKTLVAGYPWFTDWGRDTFIALRGLCLTGGRAGDARDMLLEWSGAVSEGMLPNRFPDSGELPEYNSVDASLWFVIAASELLDLHKHGGVAISGSQRASLEGGIRLIVNGYASGTRFGIHADRDGLLACGVPGSQLTWMDARVDGRSITPRVGKPVEVQALWINGLAAAERLGLRPPVDPRQAQRAFVERFWAEETQSLADVVDVDHVPGTRDLTFRPNQILAVGGLPIALLDAEQASAVVAAVERRLVTPLGLRSLAPDDPRYVGIYAGSPAARDGAYHQGTVWPWLMAAFVDAWLRVKATPEARQEARRRFFDPLVAHLSTSGLGHVSEIVDGDDPHVPRGCPFQAWSLGELMRIDELTSEAGYPSWQTVPIRRGEATGIGG